MLKFTIVDVDIEPLYFQLWYFCSAFTVAFTCEGLAGIDIDKLKL